MENNEFESLNTSALKRYVELEEARRRNKDEAEKLQEELGELEKQLLDQFAMGGMTSARVEGMTVYVHRQLWASVQDGDKERAVKALRSAKLSDFVRPDFSISTVTAWIRERDAQGKSLPKRMAEAFKVSEVFKLRTRKSR